MFLGRVGTDNENGPFSPDERTLPCLSGLLPHFAGAGSALYLYPEFLDERGCNESQPRTDTPIGSRADLLIELHHRVKNSLQTVVSVLRLQEQTVIRSVERLCGKLLCGLAQ